MQKILQGKKLNNILEEIIHKLHTNILFEVVEYGEHIVFRETKIKTKKEGEEEFSDGTLYEITPYAAGLKIKGNKASIKYDGFSISVTDPQKKYLHKHHHVFISAEDTKKLMELIDYCHEKTKRVWEEKLSGGNNNDW